MSTTISNNEQVSSIALRPTYDAVINQWDSKCNIYLKEQMNIQEMQNLLPCTGVEVTDTPTGRKTGETSELYIRFTPIYEASDVALVIKKVLEVRGYSNVKINIMEGSVNTNDVDDKSFNWNRILSSLLWWTH